MKPFLRGFAPYVAAALCALSSSSLSAESDVPPCQCPSHFHTASAPCHKEPLLIDLPEGSPDALSIRISVEGESLQLELWKNNIFGENTRFLISDESGALKEIPVDDRSYLGAVPTHPSYRVSAILSDHGLSALIIRPGRPSIQIQPTAPLFNRRSHSYQIQKPTTNLSESESPTIPPLSFNRASTSNQTASSSTDDIVVERRSALRSATVTTSTATLPPERVMDVLEYEIGVEIGSLAFFGDEEASYNGNLTLAQNAAQSIVGNLDARYLRAAGIKHRLGTVIIRTNTATDPLRNTVTETGLRENAQNSLDAFRDYWNDHPEEVGTTHDLAVYHVYSAPSGRAYSNSVGTDDRYVTSGGRGATSWANGTLTHEFGHSWSLAHVSLSRFNYYESKPRNDLGSSSAGGSEVFVSIMDGRGEHNIGRLSTGEANQVYNVRETKRAFGDLVANPGPIPPFGHRDDVTAVGAPLMIDVIANDFDANNDVLDVQLLDTVSRRGGSIKLSPGTGPGGRNELIYTPTSDAQGIDFFHYTVVDSSGLTDWGAVYVRNNGAIVVNLEQQSYQYDFGPAESPVPLDWTVISTETSGDVFWSGDSLLNFDLGEDPEINDITRDYVTSRDPHTLNHKVADGRWRVELMMGSAFFTQDGMRVSAEDDQVVVENITSIESNYAFVDFEVVVRDGQLNLEFSDKDFADDSTKEWSVTSMTLTLIELTTDEDFDDLPDDWELFYFGDLTSTSGAVGEDADGDQLSDRDEFDQRSDPTTAHSDADSISDFLEVTVYLTDPSRIDSDGDGFRDDSELRYRSDPADPDSQPNIPDLLAYYSFDEGSGSVARSAGFAALNVDAVQTQGTVGWTTTEQKIGQASLNLDGASSLSAKSPIPSSATEFTISVWVNPASDGGYKGIYAGRDHPGNWGINIEERHADIRFGDSNGLSFGVDTANNSVLASGGWYHIVQTWQSDGTTGVGSVYLNGALVGTTNLTRTDFSQPSDRFFIGDDPVSNDGKFRGQIDDLAVFSRALTSAEITHIYSRGQIGTSIVDSLAPPPLTSDAPQPINLIFNPTAREVSYQFQTQENVSYHIYSSEDLVSWELIETIFGKGELYLFSKPTENRSKEFFTIEHF